MIKSTPIISDERGDTIVEVVMAFAILALVLVSAYATASAGFAVGLNAREQAAMAATAQGQFEALQSFRDSHSWQQFKSGEAGNFAGVDSASGSSGDCDSTTPGLNPCFHMEQRVIAGLNQWVPISGLYHPGNIAGGSGFVGIALAAESASMIDFNASYGDVQLGKTTNNEGNSNQGVLTLRLANLDLLQ